jgi:hypothetical protein
MQVYMTRKQVVNKLQNKAKIEPEFTETGNEVFFFWP